MTSGGDSEGGDARRGEEAARSCRVWSGAALRAVAGVNQGDGVSEPEALCPGDTYRLDPAARPAELIVADPGTASEGASCMPVLDPARTHRAAPRSVAAPPGATLRLARQLTLLAPDGHSLDLVLIEAHAAGAASALLLPLGPIEPDIEYVLAGTGAPSAVRIAERTPLAFAAGTRITLPDGRLAPVEDLRAGDPVLTRDRGAQPIRAVLRRTERALGPAAPVVVASGTFGNAGDLILSQSQRLLIYQREPDRLTATAEMLVRAGDLVDGDRVRLRRGGFVEYVALVLDRHEMLFAEGVAVESLEVNAATLPRLPGAEAAQVAGLDHAPHYGTEAGRTLAAAARARLLGGAL